MNSDITSELLNKFILLASNYNLDFSVIKDRHNEGYYLISVGESKFSLNNFDPEIFLEAYCRIRERLCELK